MHKPTELSDTSFSTEWLRLREHVHAALEHAGGSHSERDVLDEIGRGGAQFWPGEKSVIVSKIVDYPRHAAVRFWLAGGDLDELTDMQDRVIEWARQFNVDRAEIIGRRGWLKGLDGYREVATVMEKEL